MFPRLFLIIFSLFVFTSAEMLPEEIPEGSIVREIISDDYLTATVSSEIDYSFFLEAEMDELVEKYSFTTKEKTNQIRIYDSHGMLEFILQVGSDKVYLMRSMFESGKYNLSFDTMKDRETFKMQIEVY